MEGGTVRIALIQMDSKDNVDDNLSRALSFLNKARAQGAQVVVYPENMNFLPFSRYDIYSEDIEGRTVNLFRNLAREYSMDIHLGSVLISNDGGKPYNTAVYIDRNGEILDSYRKIHLFDATLTDGTPVRESDLYSPGEDVGIFRTDHGIFGSLICYDLRFPESFRKLALEGAQVIFLPSGFSYDTGRRHWEILVRARAIENNVFIIAPNQCGMKKRFPAYGHTLAVDPDGNIIGSLEEEEGILMVEIDTDLVARTRKSMPNLQHIRKNSWI